MDYEEIFEYYLGEDLISEPGQLIKTGKEAVVYRCPAGPLAGTKAVAVKIYKDIEFRSFRNMSDYLDGRIGTMFRKRRDILHMYADPNAMQANWVWVEAEALKNLSANGLPVPKYLGSTGNSLAMEFIGDPEDGGAPRLRELRLDKPEASRIFAQLKQAIRDLLACDSIHGDLSPYNILYHAGQAVIIDLPQLVDARYHSQALAMLERDCVNVYHYFERHGLGDEYDAKAYANSLWEDYVINRLYA